jgi:hypothetical protein
LVGAFWLVGLAQVQAAEVLKKPAIPGCSQDPQVIALAGEPVLVDQWTGSIWNHLRSASG